MLEDGKDLTLGSSCGSSKLSELPVSELVLYILSFVELLKALLECLDDRLDCFDSLELPSRRNVVL